MKRLLPLFIVTLICAGSIVLVAAPEYAIGFRSTDSLVVHRLTLVVERLLKLGVEEDDGEEGTN